ncbi:MULTISPECIES: helix-turn-helix domain-containing protein [Weeksellaceae]|uniref:helix-turn-helix domain-containing protein n=1 Tax=Weeksellaceae TaxID=2762318 RepID=UPI00289CFBDA|nr:MULTISPECIES: helix-turn-helix domain-containing protein [Weeksellaceae]MDV3462942.1 hypothetical protein [Elizabethkingia anophelis]WQM38115.1 helix-turn-helix domain-containing protein [Elizabethkingia miricola]
MLLLSGFFIAIFIALILVTKKNKSDADFILFLWLVVIAMHLLCIYFFKTYRGEKYPSFVSLSMPLTLVHGPFLFLYTSKKTSGKRITFYDFLHFTPLFLWFVFTFDFYSFNTKKQIEVFTHQGKEFDTQNIIRVIITYLSGVIYYILSLLVLIKYHKKIKEHFSDIEKINFNWLLYFIIWNFLIWIFILCNQETIAYGLISFFIFWIGFFGFRQTDVFFEKNNYLNHQMIVNAQEVTIENFGNETDLEDKHKNRLLSEEDSKIIEEKLLEYLTIHKPYLNPELTLQQLAENIDVHSNVLSYVINTTLGKNFYDLINEYRIEEFINLYQNSYDKYTILALALDSGFNSKSAFNRNFKKIKGITPSEFIAKANIQASFSSIS